MRGARDPRPRLSDSSHTSAVAVQHKTLTSLRPVLTLLLYLVNPCHPFSPWRPALAMRQDGMVSQNLSVCTAVLTFWSSAAQTLNGLLVAFGCPYRRRSHRQHSRPTARTARTASTVPTTTSGLGRSTSAAQAIPAASAASVPPRSRSPPRPAAPGAAPAAQSASAAPAAQSASAAPAAQSASAAPATPAASAAQTPPRRRSPPRPTLPAAVPTDFQPQHVSRAPASPTPTFSQPGGHGHTSPARATSRRVNAAGPHAAPHHQQPKARRSLHTSEHGSTAAPAPAKAPAAAAAPKDPGYDASVALAHQLQQKEIARAAAIPSPAERATSAMGSDEAWTLGFHCDKLRGISELFHLGGATFAVMPHKKDPSRRIIRAVDNGTTLYPVNLKGAKPPGSGYVTDLAALLQSGGVTVNDLLGNEVPLAAVEAAAKVHWKSRRRS